MKTPLIYKAKISKRLEVATIPPVHKKKSEEWLSENRAALNAYNERVSQRKVFSDGLRMF